MNDLSKALTMSITKINEKLSEITRDSDDEITNIFEASYFEVNFKITEENENIRCSPIDETNSISEASYLNSYLHAHPCNKKETEEVQNEGTMLRIIQNE